MAVFQAIHAFALFTGRAPDAQRMWQCFDSAGEALGGQSGRNRKLTTSPSIDPSSSLMRAADLNLAQI
jgi:hypothetical protein